jgi:hypothetical protein
VPVNDHVDQASFAGDGGLGGEADRRGTIDKSSANRDYRMKPNLRNLFVEKLTRDRVAPITSTGVS